MALSDVNGTRRCVCAAAAKRLALLFAAANQRQHSSTLPPRQRRSVGRRKSQARRVSFAPTDQLQSVKWVFALFMISAPTRTEDFVLKRSASSPSPREYVTDARELSLQPLNITKEAPPAEAQAKPAEAEAADAALVWSLASAATPSQSATLRYDLWQMGRRYAFSPHLLSHPTSCSPLFEKRAHLTSQLPFTACVALWTTTTTPARPSPSSTLA